MKKIFAVFAVAILVGLIAYVALMDYDNNFRYGRMRQTPAVRPHEKPILIMEAGLVPIGGGDALHRATDGPDLEPPINMKETAIITRGKAVYFTFCAQCHGIVLDGNGTVGQSFHPLPTDLRSLEVQSKLAGELFKSISYGIPGGRQPPLDTTIEILDRWHVLAYIKSLGPR